MTFLLHSPLDQLVGNGLILCALLLLIIGLGFLLRRLRMKTPFHTGEKGATYVVDVCSIDTNRKLVTFSNAFAQGIVLVSPHGDQMILLPSKTPEGSHTP